MTAFQSFMANLIDYAGLFPPAKLPLDEAARLYAGYRQGSEAWMLGRFILPTTRLAEWPAYRTQLKVTAPVPVAALGRGGTNAEEFPANLRQDLADIAAFRVACGDWSAIDVIETRTPLEGLTNATAAAEAFTLCKQAGLATFHEVALTSNWRDAVRALATQRNSGFKLRCGGLEPAAFPAVEQVASVIVACRDSGVPLKCTAGLHHPVRHFNQELRTKMHGFLNVFGAGILAHAHALDTAKVQEIVADEDSRAFRFDQDSFCWRDLRASTQQIAAARQRGILSFGSCSFDEPRDDLRALGLLR